MRKDARGQDQFNMLQNSLRIILTMSHNVRLMASLFIICYMFLNFLLALFMQRGYAIFALYTLTSFFFPHQEEKHKHRRNTKGH